MTKKTQQIYDDEENTQWVMIKEDINMTIFHFFSEKVGKNQL